MLIFFYFNIFKHGIEKKNVIKILNWLVSPYQYSSIPMLVGMYAIKKC